MFQKGDIISFLTNTHLPFNEWEVIEGEVTEVKQTTPHCTWLRVKGYSRMVAADRVQSIVRRQALAA
jgi:hypothetical protein